jgi:hypothetical protein
MNSEVAREWWSENQYNSLLGLKSRLDGEVTNRLHTIGADYYR